MLDGIQDPRNLGAIIRSAYCTGADGVVIITKGASPLTAVALKSSAGLAEHMPIVLAPSASYAAQQAQQAGYDIYVSMLSQKARSVQSISFKKPVCIVVGSEGTGVSREMASYGTHVILPQRTSDISYNASVAAGILLYMVGTQIGTIE
jgi:23S rRNA (guanosine2251-2'-O)-methyltransferase